MLLKYAVNIGGEFGAKEGIGKSGVHLRWHTKSKFKKLTKEQKDELFKWRRQQKDGIPNKKPKKNKKGAGDGEMDVSLMIAKQLEKKLLELDKKKEAEKKSDENHRAYIMSLFEDVKEEKVNESKPGSVASVQKEPSKKVTLQSIIKRAKNN